MYGQDPSQDSLALTLYPSTRTRTPVVHLLMLMCTWPISSAGVLGLRWYENWDVGFESGLLCSLTRFAFGLTCGSSSVFLLPFCSSFNLIDPFSTDKIMLIPPVACGCHEASGGDFQRQIRKGSISPPSVGVRHPAPAGSFENLCLQVFVHSFASLGWELLQQCRVIEWWHGRVVDLHSPAQLLEKD